MEKEKINKTSLEISILLVVMCVLFGFWMDSVFAGFFLSTLMLLILKTLVVVLEVQNN